MKNQYFGDINDYLKYGLLRALQNDGHSTLLVAWMLTPDDGGTDGRLREYLKNPARWRQFDPELYDGLSALLGPNSPPRVAFIEGARLLGQATFHSAVVPDARGERDVWRNDLIESVNESRADLVFFDPDNGIEIPSCPIGRKFSSKYLAWQEIEEVWAAGCSLLVYQHFPRKPREAYAAQAISEIQRRIGASFTRAFRTTRVLFVLAAQRGHEGPLRSAIDAHLPRWKGKIDVIG